MTREELSDIMVSVRNRAQSIIRLCSLRSMVDDVLKECPDIKNKSSYGEYEEVLGRAHQGESRDTHWRSHGTGSPSRKFVPFISYRPYYFHETPGEEEKVYVPHPERGDTDNYAGNTGKYAGSHESHQKGYVEIGGK